MTPLDDTPLRGRRAVVLGSGIAGLAAAVALTAGGARVVVLERGTEVLAGWRPAVRERFRFLPPPPLLTAPQALAELFSLVDQRVADFLELTRPSVICRLLFEDNTALDVTPDGEELLGRIAEWNRKDARVMAGVLRRAGRLAKTARSASMPAVGRRLRWPMGGGMPRLADARTRALVGSMRLLAGVPSTAPATERLAALGEFLRSGGWTLETGTPSLRTAMLHLVRLLRIPVIRQARPQRIELRNGAVRRVAGDGFKTLATTILVSTDGRTEDLRRCLPEDLDGRDRLRIPRFQPLPTYLGFEIGHEDPWREGHPMMILAGPCPRTEDLFLDRWRLPAPAPSFLVSYRQHETEQEDAEPRHTVQAWMEAPPTGRRFAWREAPVERFAEMLATRLEAAGYRTFREGTVVRHANLPEAPATSAGTGRPVESPARLKGAAGVYLLRQADPTPAGVARAIREGMAVARLVTSDARR